MPAAPGLQSCILLRNLVLVSTSNVPGVAAPVDAEDRALWHGTTVAEQGSLSPAEFLASFGTDYWANTFSADVFSCRWNTAQFN